MQIHHGLVAVLRLVLSRFLKLGLDSFALLLLFELVGSDVVRDVLFGHGVGHHLLHELLLALFVLLD